MTKFSSFRRNRRQLLGMLMVAAVWACSGQFSKAATTAPASQANRLPNVLLIFSDDHVFGTTGCSGNKAVHTPNLDRLATSGCRFTTATVASPVCVASRASIQCSLYPQQHGSTFLNNGAFIEKVKNHTLKIMPQYLADAGYITALCGKTHMGDPVKNLFFQQGLESWEGEDFKSFAYAENFLEEKAKSDQPFFLMVTPNQPHVPLKPLPKWVEFYKSREMPVAANFMEDPPHTSLVNQGPPGEISQPWDKRLRPKTRQEAQEVAAKYYGEISHLDEQIGSLLKKLADLGLQQNTLVIYMGDNGYLIGNHGLTNKLVMYEESVRVPLLVSFPGVIPAGQVSGELAGSLDVLPTILDFAGIAVPEGLEGKSLKPLLTGKETHLRDEIFSECCAVKAAPENNHALGIGHRMVRTRQWKYMLSDANEEGLFDLGKDPYEMNNLAGDPGCKEILQQLRKSLVAWMDRVGDGHARPPQ